MDQAPMTTNQKQTVWVLRRVRRAAVAGGCFATGLLIAFSTLRGATTAAEQWLSAMLILGSLAIPVAVELLQWIVGRHKHHLSETPAWSALYAATLVRTLPWCMALACSAKLAGVTWAVAFVWWRASRLSTRVSLDGSGRLRIGVGPIARTLAFDEITVVEDLDLDHLASTGQFRARTQVFDFQGAVRGVLDPERAGQGAIRQLLRERMGNVTWFGKVGT